MRVLTVGSMYPPHHLGGYELMWRSAVGHLGAAGHDVRVLTTDYRTSAPEPSIPEEDGVHRELRWYWQDHVFPRLDLRERLSLERHNAAVLETHRREFDPHVVTWWAMGGMSLSLIERARRAGLPAVGVVVDDWMLYGPSVDGFASAFGRLRVTAAAVERLTGVPARQRLGEAGLWLFASDTLRRRALDAGWRLPRVAVAHPGVDLDLFGEAPPRPWGWRLLYCGRIDPRKGIDTAIEALEHLPAEARLTVVGGGDERHLRELRELVAARSLERRVRFLRPPRGELPSCYAEADVTVFPVRWVEPFGLVPLESMAVGTPVVATGLGGSAEYLRDRANCLLYDVEGGPPALARAVLELARDEELRARVRRQGLATAARFDERSFNEAVEAAVRAAAG